MGSQPQSQAGLTLVELMIALLIGSILLLGIVGLFATSRQTQDTQQHLDRVAEDMRFLADFMARDIRMAGYENDECSLGGDMLAWNAAEAELTLRYCEQTVPTEVIYRFDAGERRVRYRKQKVGDDENKETLVEGVVLDGIWFGVSGEGGVQYVQGSITDPAAVRTVRLNLTLRGDVPAGASPEDKALPSFEFTVAVRNNTLEALGAAS